MITCLSSVSSAVCAVRKDAQKRARPTSGRGKGRLEIDLIDSRHRCNRQMLPPALVSTSRFKPTACQAVSLQQVSPLLGGVAHALLGALGGEPGIDTSVDAARKSACATRLQTVVISPAAG